MKFGVFIYLVRLGLASSRGDADMLLSNKLGFGGMRLAQLVGTEDGPTSKSLPSISDKQYADLIAKEVKAIGATTPKDASPSNFNPKQAQPEQVASRSSSEAEAYRVASLASLSYCALPEVEKMTCQACRRAQGAEVVQVFSDEQTTGRAVLLLDKSRQEIILTFRGSPTPENWISSLEFSLAPAPYAKDVQVHPGFRQATNVLMFKIYNPIKKIVKEHPAYKLIVTGHSLGGSLAALASSELLHRRIITPNKLNLFTYGEPRTGNLAFSRWLNSQDAHITRVVNENEIVPHIPPASSGFAHHATEMYIHTNKSTICSTKEVEDLTCSLSRFPDLSVASHLRAWDMPMATSAC
ncbi:hypothetical protein DSO57_1020230 [Entomophthora muscae]|uniref:Uncharacterized protein n=1 Tax=Entomophthora muscae TaxID=34485 RepID=A0ACC2SSK6_9FUNG|nr:hypothetical protein DSO57_1020230 [Entomophthora muscae]